MTVFSRAWKRALKMTGYVTSSGDTETPSSVVIEIDTEKPKIQKVPPMLLGVESNKKCYDPFVVSIGPFHHAKQLEITEEHKRVMALQYADYDEQLHQRLFDRVKAVAADARDCYSLDSTLVLDEEKFTEMMFLDGCFILQFIDCFVKDNCKDLNMKRCLAAFVRRDLLLLENQLPFLVLRELMSTKPNDEEKWKETFGSFFALIRALPSRPVPKIDFDQYAHLLDMIHTQLIDKAALTDHKQRYSSDWFSYRSAKELKAVGIHFRPSADHQLTNVEFSSTFLRGLLKLPPLMIDDSTKSMLLNMVAYEACPDAPDDLGVSSYICFMDSLIDHAEDVKELRSKGIILNFLGSDQQVADLFNQIADDLVSNPYAYAGVKGRLEKHYKDKIKIWLAEWLHTHFTSPWTVLAFLGAIFALVLSVIQTYETLYDTAETPPCPCTAANHTT